MRETTEKRLKLHTYTHTQTLLRAQTRAQIMHTHVEMCTHVPQLRKGCVKDMNIKRNAGAWLSLKVYTHFCVCVCLCLHTFMHMTIIKIPNIL